MSKKIINQNTNYDFELLNSIGSNFIFNENPINRLKNTTNTLKSKKNINEVNKEKELAELKVQINSIEDCSLKNNSNKIVIGDGWTGAQMAIEDESDTKLIFAPMLKNFDDAPFPARDLIDMSSYECSYSVGSYDKRLTDQPLGHMIQYQAILTMKEKGKKMYYLGDRFYEENLPFVTEKQVNISNFKQGFSSQILPRIGLSFQPQSTRDE